MNIQEITEGWYNVARKELGVLPQSIEVMADKRLRTCQTCPHRIDSRCGACGCPLIAKTKSTNSTCPKGFWPINPKTK